MSSGRFGKPKRRWGVEGATASPPVISRKLRIQIIEPWKRVVLGGTGFLFGGAGVFALNEGAGAFFLLVSILGRKRTVEMALDGIDLTYLLEALF